MDIVQSNHARMTNPPEAQVSSTKTAKDSIDEILELLQGQVFQNVLRQVLVGVLVKK
jgi:hypothetical protein